MTPCILVLVVVTAWALCHGGPSTLSQDFLRDTSEHQGGLLHRVPVIVPLPALEIRRS